MALGALARNLAHPVPALICVFHLRSVKWRSCRCWGSFRRWRLWGRRFWRRPPNEDAGAGFEAALLIDCGEVRFVVFDQFFRCQRPDARNNVTHAHVIFFCSVDMPLFVRRNMPALRKQANKAIPRAQTQTPDQIFDRYGSATMRRHGLNCAAVRRCNSASV